MKGQPGLMERMRLAQREEWERVSSSRSYVPMYDFLTFAQGDELKQRRAEGWEDLTHILPRERRPTDGARLMARPWKGGG